MTCGPVVSGFSDLFCLCFWLPARLLKVSVELVHGAGHLYTLLQLKVGRHGVFSCKSLRVSACDHMVYFSRLNKDDFNS